jgi:phosphoenolpyruvate synthase/pyruvate phosphate dikinase
VTTFVFTLRELPPEQQLLAGGLVTTTNYVGWTPLVPRAAAIVTCVGVPLSHAAIIARQLGIPAVVGCGAPRCP